MALVRSEVHALFLLPLLSSESGSSAMLIILRHIGQVASSARALQWLIHSLRQCLWKELKHGASRCVVLVCVDEIVSRQMEHLSPRGPCPWLVSQSSRSFPWAEPIVSRKLSVDPSLVSNRGAFWRWGKNALKAHVSEMGKDVVYLRGIFVARMQENSWKTETARSKLALHVKKGLFVRRKSAIT